MINLPGGATTAAVRIGATSCGAALALLYFSLLVWTARDIAARSRATAVRYSAVALVLVLNVLGLLVYVLLRPRETLAERYERDMIEEILAREISTAAVARGRLHREPGGRWALAPRSDEAPTDEG